MCKSFVIIDCSYPINNRNEKIKDSIKKEFPESPVYVITWDRENQHDKFPDDYFVYKRPAKLGSAVEKLKGMRGYKQFIHDSLNKLNPSVIIASHWSDLILTAEFKRPGQILIYENLDIPTGSWPIRKVSAYLEGRALKKTDMIIHASRFFKELYNPKIKQFILENKPTFKATTQAKTLHSPLRIAYIGSVRYKEILANLVDAVKGNNNVELYIHGGGEDLQSLKEYADGISNIFFTGRYDYSQIIPLYQNADLIWAAYPNKDFNVVYAISNKFHETINLGVPGIFSQNTKLGEYVEEHCLGFTVDPYSVESIKSLILQNIENKEQYDCITQSMAAYRTTQTSWDEDIKEISDYIRKTCQ